MSLSPDPSDVLLTFAEISVAFAGFSSIVAIFQSGGQGMAAFDRFRFWVMLEHALAALLFALLPFPLYYLGLSDGGVWAVAGLGLIAFAVGHTAVTGTLASRGSAPVLASRSGPVTAAATLVYAVIVASQALNAAGLGFERSFGPYLLGLFLLLVAAGVNFVLLVARGGS